MTRCWSWLALACLLSSSPVWTDPARAQAFDLAITVDDLPAHGAVPAGDTRLGIAKSYLATLKAHGVPEAFGFVNAKDLGPNPGDAAALDAWRAAGYPLGNHTFSHLSLDGAPSVEAWEADVVAGEPAVADRMAGQDWRYLRYPYLSTGDDPARHDAAAAFLAGRGYKIASVSVSFDDWAYTETYARCRAKGDAATIAAMEARYLKGVDAAIVQMRARSQRLYGRMIPQVLLTHIGGWSARMLPAVMTRLDAAGARYVTLETAQKDPAYAQAERYPGGYGIMERTAKARGVDLSDIPAPAREADLEGLCR